MQISGVVERTECVFENIHFRCFFSLLFSFCVIFCFSVVAAAHDYCWKLLSHHLVSTGENGENVCAIVHMPTMVMILPLPLLLLLVLVELSSLNMASHPHPASSQPSPRLYALCIAVWFSLLRKSFFQTGPLPCFMRVWSYHHIRWTLFCMCVCMLCCAYARQFRTTFSRKISLHIKRFNLNGTKLFSLC